MEGKYFNTIFTSITRPKTNIAPENCWLEDEMFFKDSPFSGDILIFGGVNKKSVALAGVRHGSAKSD